MRRTHLARREGHAMGKLIYSALASLDGYVEDDQGRFDWAAPDEEVHAFINDIERPIGVHLYGRRMYETMMFWETVDTGSDQPAAIRDFAHIWRAAEKIVYSRTLQTVSSARTRIEHDLDVAAIHRLKENSLRIGHHHRWCRNRGPGARRRIGRRAPPLSRAGRRRWRQEGAAGRIPCPAPAHRRASIPKRRRSPPLPGEHLSPASMRRAEPASVHHGMLQRRTARDTGPAVRHAWAGARPDRGGNRMERDSPAGNGDDGVVRTGRP
jgi:dihydrofolate reductase